MGVNQKFALRTRRSVALALVSLARSAVSSAEDVHLRAAPRPSSSAWTAVAASAAATSTGDRSLRVRRPQAAPISERIRHGDDVVRLPQVEGRRREGGVDSPARTRGWTACDAPFCVIAMRQTRPPVNAPPPGGRNLPAHTQRRRRASAGPSSPPRLVARDVRRPTIDAHVPDVDGAAISARSCHRSNRLGQARTAQRQSRDLLRAASSP